MEKTYTKRASFKWLFYRAMRTWKIIVIFTLLVAIAAGLCSGIPNFVKLSDASLMQDVTLSYEKEHAAWQKDLDALNVQIEELEAEKKIKKDYFDNSILMQTDPYRKNVASLTLYVKYKNKFEATDAIQIEKDLQVHILKSYQAYITDGAMLEYITAKMQNNDVDSRYIKELVTSTVDSSAVLIVLKVTHTDAAKCQEMLGLANDAILAHKQTLVDYIDAHELKIETSEVAQVIDTNLADTQEKKLQYIADIDQRIKAINDEIAELPAEPQFAYTKSWATKQAIKLAIIGGAATFIILVAIAVSTAALSGKLLNPDDISSRFGIRIIGILPSADKKPFGGISKKLAAAGGIKVKRDEYGALAKTIGANIQSDLSTRKQDNAVSTVVFTGVGSEDEMQKAVEAMGIEGYNVICAANVLTSAESVTKVAEADCVVLVEAQGCSVISDIEKEVEAFKAWDKPIVGAVVVNFDTVK